MLRDEKRKRTINYLKKRKHAMLCCGRKKGRETTPDIATSPRRQNPAYGGGNNTALRPKEPPSMVIQGDFRKVSGISNEIFRQIETIENEYDSTTAAALEAVERRGEMIVRILETKNLGKAAGDAARKFLNMQDPRHTVLLVEIIKRPGQTLGLYIREGNGFDRQDGVFISRIALESAVYNSGCLHVDDEILAVNLVDVTRMSIDDVVIIMSIPRRLVLAIRKLKGRPSTVSNAGVIGGSGCSNNLGHHHQQQSRPLEPKPPPVVVIKKNIVHDEEEDDDEERSLLSSSLRNHQLRHPLSHHHQQQQKSHSQLNLDSNGELDTDLYYNSRPSHRSSTLDRREWTYQIPSHMDIESQRLSEQLQTAYSKTYPKTLETLAEKVHPFCPGGSNLGRRTSETSLLSTRYSQYGTRRHVMTRSGSDQHLPKTEYDDFSRTLPTTRQRHTLTHSNVRNVPSTDYLRQYGVTTGLPSAVTSGINVAVPPTMIGTTPTLPRRHTSTTDYASDTEASYPGGSRSSYYYCKPVVTTQPSSISGISSATLSRLNKSNVLTRTSSLRSNSLPRDVRTSKSQLPSLPQSRAIATPTVRFDKNTKPGNNLIDLEDSDGIYSAPELPSDKRRDKGNLFSTHSVFTSDEYRAWLSRTPSTSALYDQLKVLKDGNALSDQKRRFTYSAENIPERTKQDLSQYINYRNQLSSVGPLNTPLPSATVSTLDRHTRSASLRRIKHLQDLEAKHLGHRTTPASNMVDRARVLEINSAEFTKYRRDRVRINESAAPITGLLWIHLLAGRGLKAAVVPTNQGFVNTTRDLYCVLECDHTHKARTVVRNGDLVFDWDETFELDIVASRELDFLVYSWDPQYRHKLCYKGAIHLCTLLQQSPVHQIALKMEPRGTLYFRIRHTNAYQTYLRKPSKPLLPSRTVTLGSGTLFGTDIETVVSRESGPISASLQSIPNPPLAASVPIIVRRCVEEVERRGLDIIGLYRLCGSATKKRILREAFERNTRSVDLSPDNVPDINVVTGLFKDYLRELPEPLFSKYLYQMIVDALSVCLSDDPEGNAKLIFSLLDCLPRFTRATLIYIMDHLSLVASQSANNKMTPQNIAIVYAPLLMIQSEMENKDIDFNQPTNILRYLLEVWPSKSVRELIICQGTNLQVRTVQPPPLPKKPNVVLGPGGGPLPLPSKGIRRPPPVVPARCTPVVVASPVSESASSSVSTSTTSSSASSSDETVDTQIRAPTLTSDQNRVVPSLSSDVLKPVGTPTQNNEPPQIPARTYLTNKQAAVVKHSSVINGISKTIATIPSTVNSSTVATTVSSYDEESATDSTGSNNSSFQEDCQSECMQPLIRVSRPSPASTKIADYYDNDKYLSSQRFQSHDNKSNDNDNNINNNNNDNNIRNHNSANDQQAFINNTSHDNETSSSINTSTDNIDNNIS